MSEEFGVTGANPIGKLLAVVERFPETSGTASTVDGWSTVLRCESPSVSTIALEIAKLLELTTACREAVKTYVKGSHQLYLAPLDRIEQMLSSTSFNNQWSATKNYIAADTLAALRFGDDTLKQFYPAANAGAFQQLSDYIARLDGLLNECLDSELSPEIKKLFVKHLEAIRAALIEYRVGGPDAVEATLDQAFGSVMRHAEEIKSEPASTAQFVKNFLETVSNFNEFVTFTQNMISFSPVAAALLSHLK